MIPAAPTPEEAAVALAAVERFLADTTVAVAQAPTGPSPWTRAALLEGVEREPQRGVWI